MNRDIIIGSWRQFKGRIRAQWGKLTGHKLGVIEGKRAEVSGIFQKGYGSAKEKAEQRMERFHQRDNE